MEAVFRSPEVTTKSDSRTLSHFSNLDLRSQVIARCFSGSFSVILKAWRMKRNSLQSAIIVCAVSSMSHTHFYTTLSFLLGSFQHFQDILVVSFTHSRFGNRCLIFSQLNILVICKHSKTSLLAFNIRSQQISLAEHQKKKWSLETEEHGLKSLQRFVFLHIRQKGINQTYSKAEDEGARWLQSNSSIIIQFLGS